MRETCIIALIIVFIVDFIYSHSARYSSWRVYFNDWTNWLDDLAILTTLLVIPFRITNLDIQWVFVALAYIFHCLRIFKYAVIYT